MSAVDEPKESLCLRREHEIDVLVFGNVDKAVVYVAQESHNVRLLQGESQLAVLHLAEFKKLVYQPHHTLLVACYRRNGLLQVTRQPVAACQPLHAAMDYGERSTEFVTDVCEETQFELGHLLLQGYALAQHIDGVQLAVGEYCCSRTKQNVHGDCPPRQPPRGRDYHIDGVFFGGIAVVAECFHDESVFSVGQIPVCGCSLRGHGAPFVVVSLQFVLIAGLVERIVVEVGEPKRQRILVVGELQSAAVEEAVEYVGFPVVEY